MFYEMYATTILIQLIAKRKAHYRIVQNVTLIYEFHLYIYWVWVCIAFIYISFKINTKKK